MKTNIYLFELHHKDPSNPEIRYETIYEARGPRTAADMIQMVWPSYRARLLRSAAIPPNLWLAYDTACERARGFDANIRALIIGADQRYGLAYQNRSNLLSATNELYPLPALEFILDDDTFLAYAAFDMNTYRQIEAKAYMPRLWSFWCDSR